MSDHISPEDLDVAAVMSAAIEDSQVSSTTDADVVPEVSLQGVLSDLQNLAKSNNDAASNGELVDLAKSAAAAAASANTLMEKNEQILARIEKSLAALAETVSLLAQAPAGAKPLVVKSITAAVDASPLDAAPAAPMLTKSMVMDKALAALIATDDQSRMVELRSGIAKLESNFSPALIAAELRLS